jgi:hypothetical protein
LNVTGTIVTEEGCRENSGNKSAGPTSGVVVRTGWNMRGSNDPLAEIIMASVGRGRRRGKEKVVLYITQFLHKA